ALVHGDSIISYDELLKRVDRVTKSLINEGVQVESIVALMMDRSIDMIVAILAIQKAGGAYLPIDSSYPKERVEYLLEDSACGFLLTNFKEINDLNYSGNILKFTKLENQNIKP
ncbi:amino acid adenylation domain-containing protein, partial [Clostridioides difficile]